MTNTSKARKGTIRKGKSVTEAAQAEAQTNNTAPGGTEEKAVVRRSMSDTLRKYRVQYTQYQQPNGELSLDNGDEVAQLLRVATPEAVCLAADVVLGLPHGTHLAKYERLNNGQRRMNSGNKIRAQYKAGAVTIDGIRKALNAANRV